MTGSLVRDGEARHEQCRYGIFAAEAYHVDARGKETPFAMPLCAWKIEGPRPPLLDRVWSGAIDFDRDCAKCACFTPVEPSPHALNKHQRDKPDEHEKG